MKGDEERRVARELMLAYVEEQGFIKRWFITGPNDSVYPGEGGRGWKAGVQAFCRECVGKGVGTGILTAAEAVKHEPWCLTPLAVAAEKAEKLTSTNPG